jgi:polysaccharide biosynthesis transport protein
LLDLPELATIPSAKRDLRIPSGPQLIEGGQARSITGKAPSLDKALTKWGSTGSIVAESFRSAVTSILLWGRYHEESPVIVITSSHAKAGKTTSTFNLSLGLAESGRRVLVIDGDLRLGRLGSIFGVQQANGMIDILAGRYDVTALPDLIQKTEIPGLHILPAGSSHHNVLQLLHSPRLDDVLREVRKKFDFVLIDSPPLIPLTDARLLGKHADGAILICRAGQTSFDQLIATRRRLAEDGTLVIGTILNDWNATSEDPSYLRSYEGYQRKEAR